MYAKIKQWLGIQRPISEMQRIFTEIYEKRLWASTDSVSGPGSTLERTARLRAELPPLLHELGIKTLLDIPCGDFNWMSTVALDGIQVIGADIVDELIRENRRKYPGVQFLLRDLTRDSLPHADLILCRDCLFHFSFEEIFKALHNIASSSSTYLLATTFPSHEINTDIPLGGWRPLNMEAAPFCFPAPEGLITEGLNPEYPDKSLGLWRIANLSLTD